MKIVEIGSTAVVVSQVAACTKLSGSAHTCVEIFLLTGAKITTYSASVEKRDREFDTLVEEMRWVGEE